MKAKYYIYRNLHTGNFSVKHKGIVIAHVDNAVLKGCRFKVSEKGRQRVIHEKRKNVHATIACDEYNGEKILTDGMKEVYYNPYKTESFMIDNTQIINADKVYIDNNKVYL